MTIGPRRISEPEPVSGSRWVSRLAAPALAALLVLCSRGATAQDEEGRSRLSFDVFGTLGLAYSTENRADFLADSGRPDGPGHSEDVSFDIDSILAGQATWRTSEKLTAVVQVIAQQTADDDYDPALEWAYLSYQPTPDLTLRAGRLVLPDFMVSEYRHVSYANPWIRPPVEVYSLVPVTSVDGIDVSYRLNRGNWTNTFGGNFGHAERDFPRGFGTAEGKQAWNVNATFQRGGLTGRFAVAGADLTIDATDPLFDGFRAFGPAGTAIADRFDVEERPFLFGAGGVEYDPGRWFAMAEAGWLDTDSVFGERIGAYVCGGYRFSSLTTFAIYSRIEPLSDSSHPGLPLAGLPPEVVPIAAALNEGLNSLLRSSPRQQDLAVGGRWDFATGMALKLQVDFIDVLGDSDGTFSNLQPGFEPGGSAQIFSLATVFVF